MYTLKNFSETEVSNRLNMMLNDYDNICKCEKCKLDIKALALNSLSAKYTVSEQGELYTILLSEINKQEAVDVTSALVRAIEIVSANPKH
ncbi:late competence development ComFB family protein [Clostridium lacusfryxellense]|uniref:late competence development ComFB family protein n=1 Tax=Clostridium lacusfryxellense TaxID=205328 RepID=UPI001C0AF059|nr:late competence development ComFB family protein [Clostridium lacusfryxellense]MBU3111497.1 late competence development ComFB family protein [Clostridium lacusfryxellense]